MGRAMLLTLVVVMGVVSASANECVQCKACTGNEVATTCPDGYDECYTSTLDDGTIQKGCATPACEDSCPSESSRSLQLDDPKFNIILCYKCCSGSGCNGNGAGLAAPAGLLLLLTPLIAGVLSR
ncbi:uncharacterized protein LOC108669750 [Hyalella azteca]|uniref:Uncharacterized protein LOC108669750 n=1 Tax=Hyalella azteca TaxID=294128 RepID=A0A8B7NG92_HYAAZ|nr:uncharacterized protein LOC108669750 [Hyalella azteca]